MKLKQHQITPMQQTVEETIIDLLTKGYNQAEISDHLAKNEIKPNSLSSIEKKLKAIREQYGAKTMFHLAVIINQKE